jgi:HAD superfamily hydrolase (TIGR01548 family)
MPTLQVDAILFDVDGTLIDERQSYREAIRRTAEHILRSPVTLDEVDEIKRVPGFNNDWDATWALVGRRIHGHIAAPDDVDRASQAYRRLRNVFQTYYLGHRLWIELSGEEAPFQWSQPMMLRETPLIALETLERLSSFRLGIATSRPRAEALMALQQHGLDRFFHPEAVVAMEDAPREKPDAAPLQEASRRLGCKRPVYVGDSINDALAARAAGMTFVYVGHGDLGRQAVYRLHDVNEIVNLCALEGAL